jgi:hypothetical protein
MKIDDSHLSPMLQGRVNKTLDKTYNFDGRICSLRAWIEGLTTVVKSETDGMCAFNRRHYNDLPGNDEQEAYKARLKAKRYYWINNVQVPKIVYDLIP